MMRIILIFMAVLSILTAASHVGTAVIFEKPPMGYAWPFILLAAANLLGAWICGPSKKPKKHLMRP